MGRFRVYCSLGVAILGATLSAGGQAGSDQARPLVAAMVAYANGDHSAASSGRAFDGHSVDTLIAALDQWVADDPRRGPPAARFVIDAAAHRDVTRAALTMPLGDPDTRGPGYAGFAYSTGPLYRLQGPLVAWACTQLSKSGPVEPWEEWWWMTSIALLQQRGEWRMLAGRPAGSPPAAWPRSLRLARAEAGRGHIAEAIERLGPRPRLRLALAVARAAPLMDLANRFAIEGNLISFGGRPDVLLHLEEAARQVNSGRFAESIRDFEALLDDESVAGEAAIRIALLRVIRRDWKNAALWLERSTANTTDTLHQATIAYLRGWVHERTGNHDRALADYRQARALYGKSDELNTLLSAQLMRAGQRREATAILEEMRRESDTADRQELIGLLVDGDARHIRVYAQRMRNVRAGLTAGQTR